MPHLPGTPRPASSLPPGSVRAASAQAPSSSPGNIRPVKREVKVEPEKKDPLPAVKSRVPLVKVEEVTVEEGTPVKPPEPGKNGLAGAGMWAGVLCARPVHEWFYLTPFSLLGIGNSYSHSFFFSSPFPSLLSPLSPLSLSPSLHPPFSLFSFSLPPPLCIVSAWHCVAKDGLELLIAFVSSSQVARIPGHQAWFDGALTLDYLGSEHARQALQAASPA